MNTGVPLDASMPRACTRKLWPSDGDGMDWGALSSHQHRERLTQRLAPSGNLAVRGDRRGRAGRPFRVSSFFGLSAPRESGS